MEGGRSNRRRQLTLTWTTGGAIKSALLLRIGYMTDSEGRPSWTTVPTSLKEESRIMVAFSPEVLRCFTRLEGVVSSSDHFPFEMLENLQELAQGKPMQVSRAITAIGYITQATMKHIAKTPDTSASEVLAELFEALSSDEKRPVRTGKVVSKNL
jgi:hypothetical protein